jgi:ATP-dependent RNA helicase RhlE
MLFSATMPKQMEELSRSYLTDPKRVQVAPPGKIADKITQSVHFLEKSEKPAKLRGILSGDLDATTLVFARTKHGAEKLSKSLIADGYNAASIHGNKTQGQRDRAIRAFRDGRVTVLVATDVASRGIDIKGVTYVINYDLPEVPDSYVHRIGRTARAGREGEAIALCSPEEAGLLRQIQRLMKFDIPVASGTFPTGGREGRPVRRPNQHKRGGQKNGFGAAKSRGDKPARNKRGRPPRRRAA